MKTHLSACTFLLALMTAAPAAVINTGYDSIPPEQRLLNSNDPVDFFHYDFDSDIQFDSSDYIFNDRDIGYLDIIGGVDGPIDLYLTQSFNTLGIQIAGYNWEGSTSTLIEFFGTSGLVGSATVNTSPDAYYIGASNFQKSGFRTSEPFNQIRLHAPGTTGQMRIANDSLILANTAIPEPNAALLMGLGAAGLARRKRMKD